MTEPLRQRQTIVEDPAHLNFVRDQRCAICGRPPRNEAAHVRYSDAKLGIVNPGMQRRSSDSRTVPLCPRHHREGRDAQHAGNERSFWERAGIDPDAIAERLWAESGGAERHRFDAPGPKVRRKCKTPKRSRPKPKRAWPKRKIEGRGFIR